MEEGVRAERDVKERDNTEKKVYDWKDTLNSRNLLRMLERGLREKDNLTGVSRWNEEGVQMEQGGNNLRKMCWRRKQNLRVKSR